MGGRSGPAVIGTEPRSACAVSHACRRLSKTIVPTVSCRIVTIFQILILIVPTSYGYTRYGLYTGTAGTSNTSPHGSRQPALSSSHGLNQERRAVHRCHSRDFIPAVYDHPQTNSNTPRRRDPDRGTGAGRIHGALVVSPDRSTLIHAQSFRDELHTAVRNKARQRHAPYDFALQYDKSDRA